MKKKVFLIGLLMTSIYLCFGRNAVVSKMGNLYDTKDTVLSFDSCNFYVRSSNNYKNIKIKYQSTSYNKEISLNCDSYVEIIKIIKVNEQLYWFRCDALGFEQYFIWNLFEDKIYEPFFDMKKEISINKIDYENQVLFGDTWNSDKGIMPDQTISLYLFSTAKQKHFKIAEKKGETFSIELLDNCKIEYKDQNGNIVQYDYSEWVNQDVSYKASSYLIEGKTLYKPDNLSSTEGLPWASANGYGINDTIQILIPACNVKQLNFYNGFQSKEKPHLYNANSRAKKISIKCLNTNKSIYINLKDSNEKQIIDLKSLGISYNTYVTLEITILEVYPGEKYKDLCIQAIIPE